MSFADISDPSKSLDVRIRALHSLKEEGSEDAVKLLSAAFDTTDSVLLKHEFAYVLGQLGKESALPTLYALLDDPNQHLVTRHECAEAIGAIGSEDSLARLQPHLNADMQELRETAELAIARIKANPAKIECAYSSVDPAPAADTTDMAVLREMLLDGDKYCLYDRYKAMFALRNLGTEEAVLLLCEGFKEEKSCLFRHEIAFVLGQMEHKASIPSLIKRLQDKKEHPMVRHEAAEALGGIAEVECLEVLRSSEKDEEKLVADSCVVALEIYEYWSKWKKTEQ